jgi:hypothetical protein
LNVANLEPGRALDLKPQDAGASAPSNLTGCAVKSGSNTLLTDETSNVTVQLKGGNVKTGHRVQVTGSMVPNATPLGGASQVINVANVKEIGGTCTAGGATAGAATPGAATPGAATAGGASTGVVAAVVVVAVVAVGAGVGVGIAAGVGAFNSNTTNALSSGRSGAFN